MEQQERKLSTISENAINLNSGVKRERVFLRLPQVLERIPVSKSTWWSGIREGRFTGNDFECLRFLGFCLLLRFTNGIRINVICQKPPGIFTSLDKWQEKTRYF